LGKERVCKAHHLVDVSRELAMLMHARRKAKQDENEDGVTVDRARKISRMNKIRQVDGIPDTAPVVVRHVISHLARKYFCHTCL